MYCILHQKSIHLIPSIHQQAAGVSSYTPTLPLVFPAFELRRALRATPLNVVVACHADAAAAAAADAQGMAGLPRDAGAGMGKGL